MSDDDSIDKASVVASRVAVVDDDRVGRAEINVVQFNFVAAPCVAVVDGGD